MENKKSIYRVIETRDDMDKGIDNCKDVIEQQKKLIEVIESSSEENKEYFKDFVEQIKETISRYEEQVKTLSERKESLSNIIAKAKADPALEELLYDFICALGIDQLK